MRPTNPQSHWCEENPQGSVRAFRATIPLRNRQVQGDRISMEWEPVRVSLGYGKCQDGEYIPSRNPMAELCNKGKIPVSAGKGRGNHTHTENYITRDTLEWGHHSHTANFPRGTSQSCGTPPVREGLDIACLNTARTMFDYQTTFIGPHEFQVWHTAISWYVFLLLSRRRWKHYWSKTLVWRKNRKIMHAAYAACWSLGAHSEPLVNFMATYRPETSYRRLLRRQIGLRSYFQLIRGRGRGRRLIKQRASSLS